MRRAARAAGADPGRQLRARAQRAPGNPRPRRRRRGAARPGRPRAAPALTAAPGAARRAQAPGRRLPRPRLFPGRLLPRPAVAAALFPCPRPLPGSRRAPAARAAAVRRRRRRDRAPAVEHMPRALLSSYLSKKSVPQRPAWPRPSTAIRAPERPRDSDRRTTCRGRAAVRGRRAGRLR